MTLESMFLHIHTLGRKTSSYGRMPWISSGCPSVVDMPSSYFAEVCSNRTIKFSTLLYQAALDLPEPPMCSQLANPLFFFQPPFIWAFFHRGT